MKNRIQKEKEYHNKRFNKEKGREGVYKFYSITDSSKKFYKEYLKSHCSLKNVLEYGCGMGSNIELLLENGASVIGIDISDVAIEKARQRFIDTPQDRLSLYVMNAEELKFPDDAFDLICGTGILHHLNLRNAFREISRTLKPAGAAIFVEPLGHNPLINLYRQLTPGYRTEDEHPLVRRDFEMARNYFSKIELKYFHLFSMFAVPLRKAPIFNPILKSLDLIDRLLFNIFPFLGRYAWQVVIISYKQATN